MKNNFTYEQRDLILKLITWYWVTFERRGFLDFGVSKSDYEFLYSLWENGVVSYDDKMKERLNKIREIYIKTQQK